MCTRMSAAKGTIVAVLVAAFLAASSATPAAAQVTTSAKPLTKVIFSLDFIPLGRHAPWYAALAQGYFKDEGLDVSIIPSQGTAQTIQAVESGIANIAFVDVPSVVLARANGSKLKMVAVNYQKAPYAIFSLSNGANVTQPKQLEGLTLGSGAGSFTPKVIEGFMVQKGLDPTKLKIANVAPPARASALLSGQVPAIEFFAMARPGLEAGAKDAKTELRTLLLGDHGLELYSNGIAATEDYLAKNADVVKRFVRAGLKGWKFALANPQQAADDQIKYVASLKPELIVAEIKIVGDLAVTPDVKQHGFGWVDPAKMKSAVDFVGKYVGMTGTPPAAADVYATGFLPGPAITP
jgi:NitT/TauT family transport system substrate-binding protein